MGFGVFLMARGQLKLAVRAGKVSWCSVSERLPSAGFPTPKRFRVAYMKPMKLNCRDITLAVHTMPREHINGHRRVGQLTDDEVR